MKCAITAAALSLALPAGLTGTAHASGAACWQQVISDWTDGQVDGGYAPACYRAAIAHLPEDLRTNSSAQDDIDRALLEATRHQQRSIAAAHSRTRSPRSSVAMPAGSTTPLAAVLFGALGGVLVVTGALWGWLVTRRRRSTLR